MIPGLLQQLPALEASLESDGSSRNVMRVADALRLAGRPERAAELLRLHVHREPARISPRILLAWCLQDVGNIEDARAMLDTVRSIDPGNPFAREPEPGRQPTEVPTQSPFVVRPPAPVMPAAGDLPPVELPAGAETPEPPTDRVDPSSPLSPAHVPDPETEAEPERALTEAELRAIPPGPLYSVTLAEIFERQGFEEKAIEIYEEIIRQHPERQDLRERITDLRARVAEDAH